MNNVGNACEVRLRPHFFTLFYNIVDGSVLVIQWLLLKDTETQRVVLSRALDLY
jgi:hypothetical protein